jgi:thiol-disulfide isomerase/thioredoxin
METLLRSPTPSPNWGSALYEIYTWADQQPQNPWARLAWVVSSPANRRKISDPAAFLTLAGGEPFPRQLKDWAVVVAKTSVIGNEMDAYFADLRTFDDPGLLFASAKYLSNQLSAPQVAPHLVEFEASIKRELQRNVDDPIYGAKATLLLAELHLTRQQDDEALAVLQMLSDADLRAIAISDRYFYFLKWIDNDASRRAFSARAKAILGSPRLRREHLAQLMIGASEHADEQLWRDLIARWRIMREDPKSAAFLAESACFAQATRLFEFSPTLDDFTTAVIGEMLSNLQTRPNPRCISLARVLKLSYPSISKPYEEALETFVPSVQSMELDPSDRRDRSCSWILASSKVDDLAKNLAWCNAITARRWLDEVESRDADDKFAFEQRRAEQAWAIFRLGSAHDGWSHLQKIVASEPQAPNARLFSARILHRQRKIREAQAELEQAFRAGALREARQTHEAIAEIFGLSMNDAAGIKRRIAAVVRKVEKARRQRFLRDAQASHEHALPLIIGVDLLQGSTLPMQRKAGKAVVLYFWTSWCTPCMNHLPELRDWQQSQPLTDIEFFFANVDDDRSAGVGAAKDLSLTERSVFAGELAQIYNVNSFPTLLFFDGQGMLRYRTPGSADFTIQEQIDWFSNEIKSSERSGPSTHPVKFRGIDFSN